VTADCGTSSATEIDLAAERGIDVVVTDHHHAATWPTRAVGVVNPQRADSDYPDHELTGAGVAWKVAHLLSTLETVDTGVAPGTSEPERTRRPARGGSRPGGPGADRDRGRRCAGPWRESLHRSDRPRTVARCRPTRAGGTHRPFRPDPRTARFGRHRIRNRAPPQCGRQGGGGGRGPRRSSSQRIAKKRTLWRPRSIPRIASGAKLQRRLWRKHGLCWASRPARRPPHRLRPRHWPSRLPNLWLSLRSPLHC